MGLTRPFVFVFQLRCTDNPGTETQKPKKHYVSGPQNPNKYYVFLENAECENEKHNLRRTVRAQLLLWTQRNIDVAVPPSAHDCKISMLRKFHSLADHGSVSFTARPAYEVAIVAWAAQTRFSK